MDYVENVTAKRIQKCLEDETFIYSELAKLNQHYSEQISNCKSTIEIQKIWKRIKDEAFISWRVNISKVDGLLSVKSIESLKDIKSLINETLDKNQLYVSLSEINDQDYLIKPDEIDLNHQFTKLKV
jgi:adenine-specific DNA-methyltransferase